MAESLLVDTGPLVAALDASDQHHAWAKEQLSRLHPPLLTCEAVLVETQFLLARYGGNPAAVWDWMQRGVLAINFQLANHFGRLARLQTTYKNVPMSLADACLVSLSEIHPSCRVLKTDSDFRIYRRNGREKIPLIAPWN